MKGIDNLSIRELEAIAQDGSIKVPEGLGDGLRAGLDALAFMSERATPARRQWLRYATGIAASLAVIAGIGLASRGLQRPKDTFSDPEQAYAMLQSSFSYISSKMDKGVSTVTQATGSVFTMANDIPNTIK